MAKTYICSCCGKQHEGFPFSFAADYPDNYANLDVNERDARSVIGSDQCVIDGKEFWLRGCLEIPILNREEKFLWGLWANLFEEDFDTIDEHWTTPKRENLIGPFKGRLGNLLSIYPSTANLRLTIQIQPVAIRPLFFIDDKQHPLAQEQTDGIALETAQRYTCLLMSGQNR